MGFSKCGRSHDSPTILAVKGGKKNDGVCIPDCAGGPFILADICDDMEWLGVWDDEAKGLDGEGGSIPCCMISKDVNLLLGSFRLRLLGLLWKALPCGR